MKTKLQVFGFTQLRYELFIFLKGRQVIPLTEKSATLLEKSIGLRCELPYVNEFMNFILYKNQDKEYKVISYQELTQEELNIEEFQQMAYNARNDGMDIENWVTIARL